MGLVPDMPGSKQNKNRKAKKANKRKCGAVPDKPGSKHHKNESDGSTNKERAGSQISRDLKNTSRREHERHSMSVFDATVATAGYRGTKNTQIVHLRKGKGSSG